MMTTYVLTKIYMKYFLIICATLVTANVSAQNEALPFLVTPYLQIGASPSSTTMDILWHTTNVNAEWKVEVKTSSNKKWMATVPEFSVVAVEGSSAFKVYTAHLTNLVAGEMFHYKVTKNGRLVFSNTAKALKGFQQPYRFVASGDMGAGTKEAKQIANAIYKINPDFVAIAGDIVYDYGLISEYKTKFWPIYNADKVDSIGVPLMHSIPLIAAVGNHDADTRDLDMHPDALAYYHFWDQPLNGPDGKEGGAFVPLLKASDANRKAFITGAGNKYPRMANFSFNYGNAHWTVLDADNYVDWTDSSLRAWVAKDLADSKNATWHFVMYHQPGFNSSREHFEQQQMRSLAPIFEKGNVDIVFSGHVHNYQRSYPMKFVPDNIGTLLVGGKDKKTLKGRIVNGKWTLDKSFNGRSVTKPNGVIYIISGAGGQKLYNPEQNNDPDSWQKFTDKFISNTHSITVVDVNGKTITLRQLDPNGKTLDAIEITKEEMKFF